MCHEMPYPDILFHGGGVPKIICFPPGSLVLLAKKFVKIPNKHDFSRNHPSPPLYLCMHNTCICK